MSITRDFTCKEHIFLLTHALETWVWVVGGGLVFVLAFLIYEYFRLRSDNAALHHRLGQLGGSGQ